MAVRTWKTCDAALLVQGPVAEELSIYFILLIFRRRESHFSGELTLRKRRADLDETRYIKESG